MACVGERIREFGREIIQKKADEVLLRNLQNLDDRGGTTWYDHSNVYHRQYLRECRKEAQRRGLKLPKKLFNPWV